MKHRRIIITLSVAISIIVSSMIWHVSQLQSELIKSAAIGTAELYSVALSQFRTLYTSEVVEKAGRRGLKATHDYQAHENTIPLPATLSMMLGENIGKYASGASSKLYSPYPFPWRKDGATPAQPEFELRAWTFLTSNQDEPYYEFSQLDNKPMLRYATADVMRPDCVGCHNSHPESPKTDWKTGDVRGVLVVNLPLEKINAQTSANLRTTILAYVAVGSGMVFVIGTVIIRLNRQSEELERRVTERTEDLESEIKQRRQAMNALRITEEKNRLVLHTVGQGIFGVDLEEKTTFVNPAACLMFGYDESEILGQPMHALIHHSYPDGAVYPKEICPMYKALARGDERQGTNDVLWRKDGSSFSAEYTSTPMHKDGELVGAVVVVSDITKSAAQERLASRQNQLLRSITGVQKRFIIESDVSRNFKTLLEEVLDLTESEYGFIGQVLQTPQGDPYLKTFASTDIAWNKETRSFYDRLVGQVMVAEQMVLANDPRVGGLPNGHPALNHFMGLPLNHAGKIVGVVGVANRPGGYDEKLVDFIQPLLATCSGIIEAVHATQGRLAAETELSQRSMQLQSVFELSPDGFVALDNEGTVSMVNPTFEELMELSSESIVGQSFANFEQKVRERFRIMNPSNSLQDWFHNDSEKMLRQRLQRRGAVERVIDMEVRKTEEDATSSSALIYLHDNTEQVKLDRLKSEFLSIAAHELRTPMSSIFGFVELLMSQSYGESQRNEILETIHGQSNRMVQMLGELLDLAHIEATAGNDFCFAPCALGAILDASISETLNHAEQVEFDSTVDQVLPEIWVDARKTQQVFSNVFSNALKYSTGQPRIKAEASLIDSDFVRIIITDSGIGMTQQQLSKVFERFFRADTSGAIPGTGLGMSLVKEIVEIQGGRVTLESELNVGTAVTIHLPTYENQALANTGQDHTHR